jgi:hypothetical protein
MESRTIFAALRDALATLYPEEQSARVIVDDAGLLTLKIAFSSRAETNWHNILTTAIHQNCVEALLQVALSTYGTNVPLLSACGQYYHFISQGGRLEASEPLPTSAAATVQNIKTEGGTAVVGEVNTRGGTFVGRDQHNVNITIQPPLAKDTTLRKPRSIVPKPPADFVPRPIEYDALRALLLADGNASVGITAAIRGAGGYGKTTLAQALCHDPAIVEHFPDGIFWVELAQEPGELTGRVLNLVENLIDRRPGSTTPDAATSELIKTLGDKKLLLVIDDVWQAAHVAPFLQGGPHCTRLITTRINTVLPPDAPRVNVDAMQSHEATQLLGTGIRNVGEALDKLAKRLGEWPLLLRIMNAVLRERIGFGQDLKGAIADVDHELTEEGLGAFQNTASPSERHVSVTATLSVSLRLLPDLDRQRYYQLAIFPEDVDISLITSDPTV